VAGHGGEDPGFSARLRHLPEQGLTVAVTANISGVSARATDAIFELLSRVHE